MTVVELTDSPAAVAWTRRGPSGGEFTVNVMLVLCVADEPVPVTVIE